MEGVGPEFLPAFLFIYFMNLDPNRKKKKIMKRPNNCAGQQAKILHSRNRENEKQKGEEIVTAASASAAICISQQIIIIIYIPVWLDFQVRILCKRDATIVAEALTKPYNRSYYWSLRCVQCALATWITALCFSPRSCAPTAEHI